MLEPLRVKASLPIGTVAILFTDIEGSTVLWEQDGARMSQALAAHDALARRLVESRHGTVVKTTGDGMHAVFDNALDALAATVDLQQALADPAATHGVALRVRCGVHAGVVERRDNDYFGSPVNRAARIMSVAHGGQVLLSAAVVDCVRDNLPVAVSLRDLGKVRLKDLSTAEHVYQVVHADLRREFPALRSLEATPNNLPQQATSFIGREQPLSELKRLLATTRLLTLNGAGGCGKTRLCLQVAADSLDRFPDGVWLVELAPLSDPGLVAQTAATVLGLKEEQAKPISQTLIEHLRDKHLLLLLDNCEHLLDTCARLADALVRQCPGVHILASSREALGIAGEQLYRVPSLSRPDVAGAHTAEAVAQFEAVQLFTDRALLARPKFQVTDENAAALASICNRLDGIPLAIELAAARVRSMAVEEINQKLDQRFSLLTGGLRTALPRQQTLRSLIDWSYDLLNPSEQALLCRLAVFSGGWALDAAEQVCSDKAVDASSVLDVLTLLADKSLVQAEERNGETRYRLLETVRQYARDRLLDSGAVRQWRDRHLAHFLAMAEAAEPRLTGADQKVWLDRLETEHDNLRSALTWCSAAGRGDVEGLALAGALFQFWFVRGYFGEGRSVLSGLLGSGPDGQAPAARAKAVHAAGAMAWQQGDFLAARALLEESLAVRRTLGDRKGTAVSLNSLGALAYDLCDYPGARAQYEESLAIRRELGDQWGIAVSLNNLGNVACEQDDHPAALASYEASLAMFRVLGERRGIAYALNNLGRLAFNRNDYAAARALHAESLAIRQELGDRWGIASSLNNLGNVASAQGDFPAARTLDQQSLALQHALGDRRGIAFTLESLAYVASALASFGAAARLWGGAQRLREEIGSLAPPADRSRDDRRVATARAAMADDAAFDLAWKEGRAMTLEQVIDCALIKHDA
ncbi:MAG: tetratricopeptide repeat protein [Betaproteobacteria bacterium]